MNSNQKKFIKSLEYYDIYKSEVKHCIPQSDYDKFVFMKKLLSSFLKDSRKGYATKTCTFSKVIGYLIFKQRLSIYPPRFFPQNFDIHSFKNSKSTSDALLKKWIEDGDELFNERCRN